MENEDIARIYKLYGYVTKDIDGVLVCEYKQGRYFGVDIIKNGNDRDVEKIQEKYRELNFATFIKSYDTIEAIENELFEGFFQLSGFRSNMNKKYNSFIKQQMIGFDISCQYQYINSKYTCINTDSNDKTTINDETCGCSVIERVTELINLKEEPVLIIIEAAAGYGKTCTVYEIIKKMIEENREILPFYIELSRNREARIFKHILQNEIDEQFGNVVKSDVVLYQIKRGRVAVIIDGFDELLSKDLSISFPQSRDIESMLSTIVNLLDGNAKIIITSRKTAILSNAEESEEFVEEFYVKQANKKCRMARFSISEPEIEHWLGNKRLEIVKKCNFPIDDVANPVLLSYMRNVDIEELNDLVQDSKNIVDKYFEFMLKREQVRQDLLFDELKQLEIFKKLARVMTEFDIKAESKSFIKEIFKEYNKEIFDDYIRHYPKHPKPTYDDLADTLSNHALLDRKQRDSVGFINEFIFGILIGQNIIEDGYKKDYPTNYHQVITQDFANLAISAFKVQPEKWRNDLWLKLYTGHFTYDSRFLFFRDLYLKKKFVASYNGIIVEKIKLSNMNFTKEKQFMNSIFSGCHFSDCTFAKISFYDSGFIECHFYNCHWTDDDCKENFPFLFSCDSDNNFAKELYTYEELFDVEVNIEKLILGSFIRGTNILPMKRLSVIKENLTKEHINIRDIEKTIGSLKRNRYVVIDGNNCFIQREGIDYFNRQYSHGE
jgi:uncharacterized protein YjbI with pentapeptide repeats